MNYFILSYTLDTIENDKYVTLQKEDVIPTKSASWCAVALNTLDKLINGEIHVYADEFVYDIELTLVEEKPYYFTK